jgi:hypothetical protein
VAAAAKAGPAAKGSKGSAKGGRKGKQQQQKVEEEEAAAAAKGEAAGPAQEAAAPAAAPDGDQLQQPQQEEEKEEVQPVRAGKKLRSQAAAPKEEPQEGGSRPAELAQPIEQGAGEAAAAEGLGSPSGKPPLPKRAGKAGRRSESGAGPSAGDIAAAVAAAAAANTDSPAAAAFEALLGEQAEGMSCQEARRGLQPRLQEVFGALEEVGEEGAGELPPGVAAAREALLQVGLEELREGKGRVDGCIDARLVLRIMRNRGAAVGPLRLVLSNPTTSGPQPRDVKALGRFLPGCVIVCAHCGRREEAFGDWEEHYNRRSGHVTKDRLLMLDTLWYPGTYARILQQRWFDENGIVRAPPPAEGEGGRAPRGSLSGSEPLLPGSLGIGRQLRRVQVAQIESRRRLWWQDSEQQLAFKQMAAGAAREALLGSIRALVPGVLRDFLGACADAAGPAATAALQQLLGVLCMVPGGAVPPPLDEAVTAAAAADAEVLPLLVCVMMAVGEAAGLLGPAGAAELWQEEATLRHQLASTLQQVQAESAAAAAAAEEAGGAAAGGEAGAGAVQQQQQQQQQEDNPALTQLAGGDSGPVGPLMGALLVQVLMVASSAPPAAGEEAVDAYLAAVDAVKQGLAAMKGVLGALRPQGLLMARAPPALPPRPPPPAAATPDPQGPAGGAAGAHSQMPPSCPPRQPRWCCSWCFVGGLSCGGWRTTHLVPGSRSVTWRPGRQPPNRGGSQPGGGCSSSWCCMGGS